MTDDFWKRPKEEIYKARMRIHIIGTVALIVILSSIWPPLLYPYMEAHVGTSYGYHQNTPSYDSAHNVAFLDSIFLTVISIAMGILYLIRMKKMLRADPYVGPERPFIHVLVLGGSGAGLGLGIVFSDMAEVWCVAFLLAAIIFAAPYIYKWTRK